MSLGTFFDQHSNESQVKEEKTPLVLGDALNVEVEPVTLSESFPVTMVSALGDTQENREREEEPKEVIGFDVLIDDDVSGSDPLRSPECVSLRVSHNAVKNADAPSFLTKWARAVAKQDYPGCVIA